MNRNLFAGMNSERMYPSKIRPSMVAKLSMLFQQAEAGFIEDIAPIIEHIIRHLYRCIFYTLFLIAAIGYIVL